jgi:hypothetical protein
MFISKTKKYVAIDALLSKHHYSDLAIILFCKKRRDPLTELGYGPLAQILG